MQWMSLVLVTALLVPVVPCLGKEAEIESSKTMGDGRQDVARERDVVVTDTQFGVLVGGAPHPLYSGRLANVGKGALSGLMVGAGAGALVGLFAPLDEPDGFFGCILPCTRGEAVGLYAVLGAGVGLGIGVLVGAVIPAEHREIVDRTRISISPQRHGGLALSASYDF